MEILKQQKLTSFIILLVTFTTISLAAVSQEKYQSQLSGIKYQSQLTSIMIAGTSTLHDWEMKSSQGHFEGTFLLNSNDVLTSITGLTFSMPSESLKSGHGMMDDNTYKALKTKAYNNISFVLSTVAIAPLGENNYQLKCFGKLTIAGTTRETDLLVTCKWNPADKSFSCSGSKKIKMTEYNVKPPTIMMGTIKTGDDITITYNLKINKS